MTQSSYPTLKQYYIITQWDVGVMAENEEQAQEIFKAAHPGKPIMGIIRPSPTTARKTE